MGKSCITEGKMEPWKKQVFFKVLSQIYVDKLQTSAIDFIRGWMKTNLTNIFPHDSGWKKQMLSPCFSLFLSLYFLDTKMKVTSSTIHSFWIHLGFSFPPSFLPKTKKGTESQFDGVIHLFILKPLPILFPTLVPCYSNSLVSSSFISLILPSLYYFPLPSSYFLIGWIKSSKRKAKKLFQSSLT